jgi:hypothetical protein
MQRAAQTYGAVAKQTANPGKIREISVNALVGGRRGVRAVAGYAVKRQLLPGHYEDDAAAGTNFIATPFMQ